jgi:glycosyltransferase involved in cell wall biosynthesis
MTDQAKFTQQTQIIVNASALRLGGGLTILKQFIDFIPDDGVMYLVFIDESISIHHSKENVHLYHVNTRSFIKRTFWDIYGINKWLKNNNLVPNVTISLQNTIFYVNVSCPNYIYYHQPIPFYPYNWSFLKRNERILWFYKNVYSFFVKLFFNSNTEVIVQLEFVKEGFAKKFDFAKDKIHVIFPNIEIFKTSRKPNVKLDKTKFNLFYPAGVLVYKNHNVLFESLFLIDERIERKIALYLTGKSSEFDCEFLPKYKNVEIIFLDKISHPEVIWLFENVDSLVFPSYIETFGLPLIEAATFGLPIIAADLPYAREVLSEYDGVFYVDYRDPIAWGNVIESQSLMERKKYEPIKKNIKSWVDFFEIIKSKI